MSKFLIVGLGNIGEEYEGTRHNIGFDIADELIKEFDEKFSTDRFAQVAKLKWKGKIIVLLKPTTFMNLSGKAINYWMQAEKIPIENILVLVDELALPIGKIRINPKGSDGGHNGLKNIQDVLGTTQYARLRFGISNDFPKGRQVDFVLGKWSREEENQLVDRKKLAVAACKSFVAIGLERTMNEFNNK